MVYVIYRDIFFNNDVIGKHTDPPNFSDVKVSDNEVDLYRGLILGLAITSDGAVLQWKDIFLHILW